jgi:N-methyl-L-tryptophan oxidase
MQTAFFEHSSDRHFIIGELADHPKAWVIAGLSGHGFKYAFALVELAKDLVLGKEIDYDLTPFPAR